MQCEAKYLYINYKMNKFCRIYFKIKPFYCFLFDHSICEYDVGV